jgi:hypothetical protein
MNPDPGGICRSDGIALARLVPDRNAVHAFAM